MCRPKFPLQSLLCRVTFIEPIRLAFILPFLIYLIYYRNKDNWLLPVSSPREPFLNSVQNAPKQYYHYQ